MNSYSTVDPDVTCTVWPADAEVALCSQPCEESASGVSAMPEEPTASRVPPEIVNVPFTSSAPLPLLVGPQTTMVPPVISASPLESKPSPPAFRTTVPPLTTTPPSMVCMPPPRPSALAVSAETFRPSSELVTSISPPLMRMSVPSRPS